MNMKRYITGLLLILLTGPALAGPWPADDVARDKLDNPENDTVAEAWPQLYAALGRLKDVIGARGAANGVASLDATSKIPFAQLPTTTGGVQANDSDLSCLAGLSTSGVLVRTGTGTCATRSIGVGSGMSITNGNGVAGDPSISLSANLQTWSSKTPPTGTAVGTTDTQTLTNKTLTTPVLSSPTISNGTVNLTSGTLIAPSTTTPAQTAEGEIKWDSDNELLTVGTGSARKTLVDTDTSQSLSGKLLASPTFSGTATGTYTLGGAPTIAAPAISNPVFSGTFTGTYSLGGTPTVAAPVTFLKSLGAYAGLVNSDGSAISLPSGWSSTRNSVGNYTVTHNLGQAGYVVIGTVEVGGSTDERIFNIYSRGTNSFSYKTRGGAGGSADEVTHFILYDY